MFKYTFSFLVVLFSSAVRISAQDPDPTFGNAGETYISFSSASYYFSSMDIQSTGKIIVAGSYTGILNPYAVCRLNSDGLIDSSFQINGVLTFGFGYSYENSFALCVDSQDRILIGGMSNGDYALARLLPNGDLDSSFSLDGKVKLSFGPDYGSSIKKIIVQPDGKLLAIGEAYGGTNFNFSAARFLDNGVIDSTFGVNGFISHDVNNFNDFGRDAILLDDGRIVVAGSAFNSLGYSVFALIMMNPDGTLHTEFGNNGKVFTSINAAVDEVFESIKLHPNGTLIASGYSSGDFALLCYHLDGTIEQTFGTNGHTITDFGDFQDKSYAMAIDAQGRILLGGDGYDLVTGDFLDFAMARYTEQGTLDTSFSDNGKFVYKMGAYSSGIRDMFIQNDGKILVGGNSFETMGGLVDLGILRLDVSSSSSVLDVFKNEFQIFPNPTAGSLQINSTTWQPNSFLKLFSLSGQLLEEWNVASFPSTKDFPTLLPGVYFLTITSQESSHTFRFIRQ